MYIAIDVGSTNIRVASFLQKDGVISQLKAFKNSGNFDTDFENMSACITEFVAGNQVEGIGICVPGVLNKTRESVVLAANIKHWVDMPIVAKLSEKFKTSVKMDNDAVCAGKGEFYFGNYNQENFLFVIWGTGVGGMYVLKPNTSEEPVFLPSELGHQIVEFEGAACGCGQQGCLELYIGGGNFEKTYGQVAESLTEDDWEMILTQMAHGLVNAINIIEVPFVVLGGNVSAMQAQRISTLEKKVNDLFRGPKQIHLSGSTLLDNAGVLGALSLL